MPRRWIRSILEFPVIIRIKFREGLIRSCFHQTEDGMAVSTGHGMQSCKWSATPFLGAKDHVTFEFDGIGSSLRLKITRSVSELHAFSNYALVEQLQDTKKGKGIGGGGSIRQFELRVVG
ncbi:hypothetical protein VNO77_18824 [Canavalia gladiata]|uniref:Uncharacterized protein n=1 Tax=Canavalia gladiata TaxID=3824 RepID=A0AAN9QJZ6_CANGL